MLSNTIFEFASLEMVKGSLKGLTGTVPVNEVYLIESAHHLKWENTSRPSSVEAMNES